MNPHTGTPNTGTPNTGTPHSGTLVAARDAAGTQAGGRSTNEHHQRLPQLSGPIFVTDGGLETTLIFHDGLDLADFAAFPLLDSGTGRAHLARYYRSYLDVAARNGVGIVLDTPTWRASPDWGARLGYDSDAIRDINVRSVEFIGSLAAEHPSITTVLNGAIGPRGDGYAVGEEMTATEASRYHRLQAAAFASAGVDMVTAVTMTNVNEAIGVTLAAAEEDLPVVIGFTVETNGVLPSGTALGRAVAEVDDAAGAAGVAMPAYYMVNCAHPSHFQRVLGDGAEWTHRVKAIRANASRMSHEELDNAEELDRGDPVELASEYASLQAILPDLRVVGGCCGTDHEHVSEITRALLGA